MANFKHIHSSGRFDRSPASLAVAYTRYCRDADLITGTEVQSPGRVAAVKRVLAPDFGFVYGNHGHANDAVVSYRKSRFSLVYSEAFKASNVRVYRSDGHIRDPLYSTIAVLEEIATGHRIVVAVTHYASHVEGDIVRKHRTGRVRQWYDSVRRVKNRVNALAKTHKAGSRVFVGDFNINFKRVWARSVVKAIAPAYHITWKKTKVAGGTHGNRIIDATFARGRLLVLQGAKLYTDDASSDHRPYIETLRLTG